MSVPRAAIYTRVSSDLQEDNYSLPTQEAACRQYCDQHGYQVVGVFSDVHTGAQYRERPGLSQLRELMRQRALDVVVCYAVDRLSRNQAHLYILVEELADHGCRLEFVTERFEDTAVGRFILAAKSFAAEIEREKIAERTMRGRLARAEAGKLMSPVPLYGYRWADAEKTRYEPDPETAPIVRRIFALALQGQGVTAIANMLTAEGIPTPYGRAQWSLTTVWRILTNRTYTGQARAFTWRRGNSGKRSYRRDWDAGIALPPDVVPALVDPETFAAVQERLRLNRLRSARRNRSPELWLLRGGYARCGVCGATMTACHIHGAPGYRCANRTRHPDSIARPGITADELDAIAWRAVHAAMERDDVLQHGMELVLSQQPSEHELAGIERVVSQLKRQQANLAKAIALASDDTALGTLMAELERVAQRLRELEAERDTLVKQARAWERKRSQLQELTRWRRQVAAYLDQMGYRERRWLLDLLGLVAHVYPAGDAEHDRVEISMALPLAGDFDLQTS
ncbi:recombinase family protein [Thermomicrobiaceae bacterium CFH 74404]|uniref:Recombinase family protein n=1 Tax=Thermalbibacter longus TaxID=2951981 RepID=A0AA42BB87_9BACT|nr:recombinase family protein [Thermalbibacter longus]MCM8749564.1 recombinase family protein [Thermalbibacter longus]